jgi:hypothetical protein
VATVAYQIHKDPVVLPKLEILDRDSHCFSSSQATANEQREQPDFSAREVENRLAQK